MGKAFITARCRDRVLYIEKSEIISVIKSPRIWKVPGAPEEISGIMQHEDKLVVFYKISCLDQPPCAVLMNGGSGSAFGFGAEEMGEELAVAP